MGKQQCPRHGFNRIPEVCSEEKIFGRSAPWEQAQFEFPDATPQSNRPKPRSTSHTGSLPAQGGCLDGA